MGSLPPFPPLCDISSKLSTHETNLITPNSRRPIREKTGWNPIFIRKHKQRNIYLYNTATKKCKKSFQTDYTDRRWGLLKNLLKKPRNHKGESHRTVGDSMGHKEGSRRTAGGVHGTQRGSCRTAGGVHGTQRGSRRTAGGVHGIVFKYFQQLPDLSQIQGRSIWRILLICRTYLYTVDW